MNKKVIIPKDLKSSDLEKLCSFLNPKMDITQNTKEVKNALAQLKLYHNIFCQVFSKPERTILSKEIDGILSTDLIMVYGINLDFEYNFAPHYKEGSKLKFLYLKDPLEHYKWHALLPEGFSECEECIFEYIEPKNLKKALQILRQNNIKTKRDDEFFQY